MNQAEFAKAINQGLGRAIQHLQTHDATPYLAAIEYACLNNTAYDPQCEATRDAYLFEIIQLTGQSAYFLDRITRHLFLAEEYDDLAQLYRLTRMFVQIDFPETRKVLYERFDKFVTEKEMGGSDGSPWHRGMITKFSEELIILDSLDAVLWITNRLGQELNKQEDYYIDDSVLYEANEHFGKNEVANTLTDLAATNPNISAYTKELQAQEQKRTSHQPNKTNRKRNFESYKEFKQKLLNYEGDIPPYIPIGWSNRVNWGNKQSANEDTAVFNEAATDLLQTKEPRLLTAYLRIFWRNPFPLGCEPLFPFTKHDDEEVVEAALDALAHFEHPTIRELAVTNLQRKEHIASAINMLTKNFHEGDFQLIADALTAVASGDDWHDVGWVFHRGLMKSHLSPEAADCLIMLYENTPCSNCRLEFIKFMNQTNTLPNWIIEEGCFDCDPEIRQFCKELSIVQSEKNFTHHESRITNHESRVNL